MVVISILCLCACADNSEEREKVINKEVQERIKIYRTDRRTDCIEEIVAEAIIQVDSFMLRKAIEEKFDSIIPPERRERPDAPNKVFPEYQKPEKPAIGHDTI